MGWKTTIEFMLLLGLLGVAFGYFWDNLPGDPVVLVPVGVGDEFDPGFNYGPTPVFMENLRFDHTDITYSIRSSCPLVRQEAIKEAITLFEDLTAHITLTEKIQGGTDILIGCSNDFIPIGEDLFAAGEGGPSKIINTSTFKIIEQGRIVLFEDPQCDFPVVEMHELLHVFGFDHTTNPKSIMYNISKCNQVVTNDIIILLDELYAVPSLSDLSINELSAVKKGKFLDFNITVLNEGLVGSPNVSVAIFSDGEEVDEFFLGTLEAGSGVTFKVKNTKLPSKKPSDISFIVDKDNEVLELKEVNNKASLFLS